MKKNILVIFIFVISFILNGVASSISDSTEKNIHFFIHPQYTNVKEHIGVYFGWDELTVDDKYSMDRSVNVLSIDFGMAYKTYIFIKGHYSNTESFGLGRSENQLSNAWFNFNYKFTIDEAFSAFVYYSRYKKQFEIPRDIKYDAKNSKYLIGVGVCSYGLSNVNFSNLSQSGGHGIIYLGAGSFENKVWMSANNPNAPRGTDWEYIARENIGFVFFMDMGGLYNSGRFYAGAKLKVGGFFSGEVVVNGVDKTDEVITGTIAMEAVGGVEIIENLTVGLHWKHNNENNRNESDEYDQDGSSFYNYITNVFVDFNFSF